MKTLRMGILFIVAPLTLLSADPGDPGRTLINDEQEPLVFALFPAGHDDLSPPTEERVFAHLSQESQNLRAVAPKGMMPVAAGEHILLGYYAGTGSGITNRAVVLQIDAGDTPIRVDRTAVLEATPVGERATPRGLPDYPEPVIIDGLRRDWEDDRPAATIDASYVPKRIELASQGRTLNLEEAVFWRLGGTAVRRVYLRRGESLWFAAIHSEGPILNDTGFHVRLVYTGDTTREPILAEFAVLVDGRSGPVVYRRGDQPFRWAGQYALREGFIEFEVEASILEKILRASDGAELSPVSLELASSHRTRTRTERFSFGSYSPGSR